MDTQFHFQFLIANGKWKMGIHFRFFIFHLRWKIQNGQLKKPRKRQRISWSAGTITAKKPLLTANVDVRRSIMQVAYTKTIFCLAIW